MKIQIRPSNGQSFWNLSGISWEAVTCGKPPYHDDPWVTSQGRTWLRKFKDESICEVVGYQIAEALELPLQPWAAFHQAKSADRFMPKSGIGILVEKRHQFRWEVALWAPAKTLPTWSAGR